MRPIRVALAQINCIVGDLPGNAAKIIDYIRRAADMGVDLLVFPELAVSGYPPEDLLLKPGFVTDCRDKLDEIIEFSREAKPLTAIVGCVDTESGYTFNGAAVINNGRLSDVYHKILLPNYGVFDEQRYFKPGAEGLVVEIGGVLTGISICEDIWHPEGPLYSEVAVGAEIIVNINASPYHIGKGVVRARMLACRAKESLAAVCYANLVGGQDELVFDGQSYVFGRSGEVLARGRQFVEDLIIADIDVEKIREARQGRADGLPSEGEGRHSVWPVGKVSVVDELPGAGREPVDRRESVREMGRSEEALAALELGVRDYVRKNRFSRVLIGLSGGVDSALTAVVAAAALGPENVVAVFMPSRYTSDASREDATALAENLGVELMTIPIEPIFGAYLKAMSAVFKGRAADTAEENLQARVRGNILMALSNKFGWLLLSTGNKSEMSVGYATLYGDMSGGFAVLKDVPKTLVYRISEYVNDRYGREAIPERVLTKAPSAELRDNQKDSDSLPPYEILDPIIEAYVEEDRSAGEIIAAGYDPKDVARVIDMIDRSEYKRRQAPPGVKITGRAFGKDWRLPITNWYKGRGKATSL